MADDEKTKTGVGLALSGGGYRSALFALGGLWRLNELGFLPKLTRITSVSGGSITSGILANHWNELIFDNEHRATNFKEVIAVRLQEFCSKGLDVKAGLSGLLSFRKTIADKVAEAYDKRLFSGFKMSDIPSGTGIPEFVFYATNFQTGDGVQITRDQIYDYKLGKIKNPVLKLAAVVGASSAFPPLLSPVVWDAGDEEWHDTKYTDKKLIEEYPNLRKKLILTDGGLYDNLGLEAVWNDNFETVIVCDAGAPMRVKERVWANWASQWLRMTDIMINQQRALRKRQLIKSFEDRDYRGTYFGVMTEINNYKLSDSMIRDSQLTRSLKSVPTRLCKFEPETQGHLINWGYALCDTAMRKYVVEVGVLPKPQWPVSKYPLNGLRVD